MRTLLNSIVGVLALVSLLESVRSAPVFSSFENAKAVAFLYKYGYLAKTNSTNSSGGTHIGSPVVTKAIQAAQKFGGLPVTGELNLETRELLSKKRCGLTDPTEKLETTRDVFGNPRIGNYYLQGSYWKKKDLTYRIKNYTPDLDSGVQKDILGRQITKWAEVSSLSITEQKDPSVRDNDVDILVRFVTRNHGDPYSFDGSGGTLAHAYYPHNNKGLSGDAHFDDDEFFTTGTPKGINLDWVAAHEFGHSLGLQHSNVRESIMYPWYKGYIANIVLTADDIAGIRGIYGAEKPVTKKSTPPHPTKPRTKPIPTEKPMTKKSTPPRPTKRSTKPIPTDPPTVHPACKPGCRYDAIVVEKDTRGTYQTHFIKGIYFWTVDRNLRKSDPKKVRDYWPHVRTPLDAAYRNERNNIVFFSGNQFWEYNNRRQLTNRRSGRLERYGLSSYLINMDAVFTWQGNRKTYFFKGTKYWRYNNGRLDSGYPRDIGAGWPDLSDYDVIDAAVTWPINGRSYFFSGQHYLKLENRSRNRKVYVDRRHRYPQNIATGWMKCNVRARVGAIRASIVYP